MPSQDKHANVSYRNGEYVQKKLLQDSKRNLKLMKWATNFDMPKNAGNIMDFRRYNNVARSTAPIYKNTNPTGSSLDFEELSAQLELYGTYIDLPKKMLDTHEDNLVDVAVSKLVYHKKETLEYVCFDTFREGTQIHRTGTAADTDEIVEEFDEEDIEACIDQLEGNDAEPITELVTTNDSYDTANIAPCFIAYCHPNLSGAFRNRIPSFIPFQKYADRGNIIPGEIGMVGEKVRVVTSTAALRQDNAGAGPTAAIRSGTANHVYDVLIMGKDAIGCTKLTRDNTKVTFKRPAKNGDNSDKLGLVGHAGYSCWFVPVILNNKFMIRLETASQSY